MSKSITPQMQNTDNSTNIVVPYFLTEFARVQVVESVTPPITNVKASTNITVVMTP